MTAVDDLAAWLTKIWDEDEAIANQGPDWRQGGSPFSYFETSETIGIEVNVPWLLARIAADRQILALHAVVVSDANHAPLGPTCSTCGAWEEYPEDWPCQTVKLLALPHAGRPGYQEAWRPE